MQRILFVLCIFVEARFIAAFVLRINTHLFINIFPRL